MIGTYTSGPPGQSEESTPRLNVFSSANPRRACESGGLIQTWHGEAPPRIVQLWSDTGPMQREFQNNVGRPVYLEQQYRC